MSPSYMNIATLLVFIISIRSNIGANAFVTSQTFVPSVAVRLAPSSVQQSSSNNHYNNDPRVEPRTTHHVTIELPLGIFVEEMDASDPSYGVAITGINNDGNAAKYNADTFSNIKSQENKIDSCHDSCICIRDKIMKVNDTPCHDKSFDDVISLISSTESNAVTLELGRLQQSTVVNYYNGICISAIAGESYGFLAGKCDIDIDYECRSGTCQTCMRWLEFPDKDKDLIRNEGSGSGNLYERTILHCVGKVPRGYQWLHVLDPYYSKHADHVGT